MLDVFTIDARVVPNDLMEFFEPAECGECFVCRLVDVFCEARRVLADDGTMWLNIGDSYAGGGTIGRNDFDSMPRPRGGHNKSPQQQGQRRPDSGFKPKDLIGIPWLLAFALRDDGWVLRQEIIWSKPNPMPESVTDRCTKSHESVFLLAKSGSTTIWRARDTGEWSHKPDFAERLARPTEDDPDATVARWRGYDYYYDATAVAEVAIEGHDLGLLRGRSGVGENDGVAWHAPSIAKRQANGVDSRTAGDGTRNRRSVWTIATQPFAEAHYAVMPPRLAEDCIKAGCPKGGVVLDPFGGAGTTALAALRHGRKAVLIELSPDNCAMARRRIEQEWRVPTPPDVFDAGPLFALDTARESA